MRKFVTKAMVLRFFRRRFGGQHRASTVEVVPDQVWISSDAKLHGIRKALEVRSAEGAAMIALVAHFPDLLGELERIAAEYRGPASVRAVLARQLSREVPATLPLGESDDFDLIVAERHPLRPVDEELLQFAEALPCRCRIVHHLSFDDALLRSFVPQSSRAAIGRMAGTGEEPITHRLVDRSLERAQRKVEDDAIASHDADSAAEWLERNTR